MAKHLFENICIDFNEILSDANFKRMLKTVEKQAKTTEAKKRTDIAHYKEYGNDQWSPMYFGMFVEWFCQMYLNYFGYLYNVANVEMMMSEGSSAEDYGVDGIGVSMRKMKHKNIGAIVASEGSPVFIQVKGTMNYNKEYTPNCGARLPNFTTNAMSQAIKQGHAYQARYILFTTGKGVHYTLNKMWNDLVEVISIHDIDKLANNNTLFLNVMRQRVDLEPLPVYTANIDSEAAYHETLEIEEQQ